MKKLKHGGIEMIHQHLINASMPKQFGQAQLHGKI